VPPAGVHRAESAVHVSRELGLQGTPAGGGAARDDADAARANGGWRVFLRLDDACGFVVSRRCW
jgi:hypothetical protein